MTTTAAHLSLPPAVYADAMGHLCPVSLKLGFATKEDAAPMLAVLLRDPGRGWKRGFKSNVFFCLHCGRWHVGRRLRRKRGARAKK